MNKKLIAAIGIIILFSGSYWLINNYINKNITHDDQNVPITEQFSQTEMSDNEHELEIESQTEFQIIPETEVLFANLGQLWGIDFIPNSPYLLATENSGKLYLINTENSDLSEISGIPTVNDRGQGGLLDIAISPDFNNDNKIFLTYSASGQGGTTTHLASANVDLDNLVLNDLSVLYVAEPFKNSTSHFGSRVVIQGDHLFMSIGDRGDKNFNDHVSQDTSNVLGTVIRLNLDGSIPDDNPFVGNDSVLDEIYSYGHRNPQGLTFHPETGELWMSDHGERDGDEVNVISAGGNYGWPVAHTGCGYITRRPIGVMPQEREDIINPIHYWECGTGGFPPAGMTFYDAEGFDDWRGDLFVGGLASQYLAHFRLNENGLEELEPLLEGRGWRIRDVAFGDHDGSIYVAVEGRSESLVRIVPVKR